MIWLSSRRSAHGPARFPSRFQLRLPGALEIALIVAAVLLSFSPAYALDKSINGITVDVNLPHARRGVDYQHQISPSGQVGPYTFEITGGALPAGFSLSAGGLVSGVSCVAPNGTYKFDVRITSANGVVADFSRANQFSVNMTGPPCDDADNESGPTDPEDPNGTGPVEDTGTTEGDGTSDGSDGATEADGTDGTNGGEEPGETDPTGGSDGSDASDDTGAGTPNTDVSDVNNGTEDSDSTEPAEGDNDSENPGETDGADPTDPGSTENPELTEESDEADSNDRSLSANDGEIIIDLSTSSDPRGSIDLATLVEAPNASAGPLTFEIVGEPASGNASIAGSILTYTSREGADQDAIHFVAVQGDLRSSAAVVSVRISRGSLATDTQLTALVPAQLDAVAEVGFLQVNNIAGHLEAGMWGNRCRLTNRVSVHNPHQSQSGDETAAPNSEQRRPARCSKVSVVSAWISGRIAVDDREGKVSTDGLTAGLEAEVTTDLIAGIALGFSSAERHDEGSNKIDVSSLSVGAYGAWRPLGNLQIAGAVGYAEIDTKVRRHTGVTDSAGRFERDGRLWFGMLSAAADFNVGKTILSSYGRVGFADIHLGDASEVGSGVLTIDLDPVDQTQLEGAFGGTIRRPFQLAHGLLTPFARLEARWRNRGEFSQGLSYADEEENELLLSKSDSSLGWSLGAGAQYVTGPVNIRLEYRSSIDATSLQNRFVRLELSTAF